MLGLALKGEEGFEYGVQYYDNGYITLLGQCTEVNIYGQDGAWNESVRYHNAAISKICVFAKAIRNMVGVNWFGADSAVQLGKSLYYNVLVQAPSYQYGDSVNISTPVYGDHIITDGSEFAYLGMYVDEVAKVNPIQAYSMYQTWKKAGAPLAALGGEENMIENFFVASDFNKAWLTAKGYTLEQAERAFNSIGSTDTGSMGVDANLDGIVTPEENLNVADYWKETEMASTAGNANDYKSHSIMIFRNHFNEIGNESFLSMMANESKVAHNHKDQLAIQMFANGTPLIIDPGIGSYWDLSKGAYTLSSSHGLTQFVKADGSECATLDASAVAPAAAQLDFYASDIYDYMSAQTWLSNSHTDGTITRSIGYLKKDLEAYVIWDRVDGESDGMTAQYNLPIYAKETPIIDYENNVVNVKGFHNTNLDVMFLEGNLSAETAKIDTIMLPTTYKVEKRNPSDSSATADLLHVKSESANQDFLTVLFPSDADSSQHLESKKLDSADANVNMYELTYTEDDKTETVYIITNASDSQRVVSIPDVEDMLVDLKSASLSQYSANEVTVKGNSMMLLRTKSSVENDTNEKEDPDNNNNNNNNNNTSSGGSSSSGSDSNVTAPEDSKEEKPETVVETKPDGSTTETSKVTVSTSAGKEVEAEVVVSKNAKGKVTEARATISAKKGEFSKEVVNLLAEAAGTNAITVTVEVKDTKGKVAYTVTSYSKDLKAKATMKVFAIDKKTGEYELVNAKSYKADKDGNIAVSLPKGANYQLLSTKEAEKVEKAILKTVAVKKTTAAVKKGKSTKIQLSSKLNMDNVKTVTYASAKKSVATVSKSGKITGKKKGSVWVKATVTLKNGKKKTVSMKITVK